MHPETQNNELQNPSNEPELGNKPGSVLNTASSAIFYLAILFFIIGFNFSDVMVGNWYQQTIPTPSGSNLKDIHFIDSLVGFAVTDSALFKTTNSGDSWTQKLYGYYIFQKVHFINSLTGFACAGNNKLLKTTNAGESWDSIQPGNIYPWDMSVLNEDTIWLADAGSLVGGVFRTTNGGSSWEQQFSAGADNPEKIYMFNARIGFISPNNIRLYKTTNSGQNWTLLNDSGFTDMHFIDSLTGWKNNTTGTRMKKTTDGGLNWFAQNIPIQSGNLSLSRMRQFSITNKDTLWGVGGVTWYGGNNYRGIIYHTTNGGINWLYQIPDTSIYYYYLIHSDFVNKQNGWVYLAGMGGLNPISGFHTKTGGDTTFILPVSQISSQVPKEFELEQNFPNPFNPSTKLRFKMSGSGVAVIKIFDMQGKEVSIIVNEKLNAGEYEYSFNANNLSSGVYFYSLIVDGHLIDTKKMLMIK